MILKTATDALALATVMTGGAPPVPPAVYEVLAAPEALVARPFTVAGQPQPYGEPSGEIHYRSPGTRFETVFEGDRLYFKVGAGDATLHVVVDGHAFPALIRPTPGYYEISDLSAAPHRVRIEAEVEPGAGPAAFDGFFMLPTEGR